MEERTATGTSGRSSGSVQRPADWVRLRSDRKLHKGMFVAQVQGQSMEPRIPDGAYCVFHSPVAGSREGRVVLASHRGIADASMVAGIP